MYLPFVVSCSKFTICLLLTINTSYRGKITIWFTAAFMVKKVANTALNGKLPLAVSNPSLTPLHGRSSVKGVARKECDVWLDNRSIVCAHKEWPILRTLWLLKRELTQLHCTTACILFTLPPTSFERNVKSEHDLLGNFWILKAPCNLFFNI